MSAIDAGPGFVHLRVHSAFSLLEGPPHIKDLVQLAKASKHPAVAVTAPGNLFGAHALSQTAGG